MINALQSSVWVKLALYLTFVLGCAALVMSASDGHPTDVEITEAATDFSATATYAGLLAVSALAMLQMGHPKAQQGAVLDNSRVVLVLGGIIVHLVVIRLVSSFTLSIGVDDSLRFLLIPFALAPMLLGILLGRAIGCFTAIYASLIGSLLFPRDDVLAVMVLSLTSGVTAVLMTDQIRKRIQLLHAGLAVGAVTWLMAIFLGYLAVTPLMGPGAILKLQVLAAGSLSAFGVAIFTSLFISGLLPVFEGVFHVTTSISWLELSDLNHKLLRQMQLEAPGTFHHSLVVASLAEAAAERIGADAPMCRVSAYFHDVGKLKKPVYFIENQIDGVGNPHDALTPTMSALIIIAHVKDGVDLAVKHKLNPRIIDVIKQHHGDSLVSFFYRKAQEQKRTEMEKVDRGLENPEDLPQIEEKNFRYPGPRPNTRESGIIALADTIESASRTLRKPTPGKIRALVDELVRVKLQDGQLDRCPLTIQDLATIKDSFTSTLRSMMHKRIDYPEDDRQSGGGKSGSDSQRIRIGGAGAATAPVIYPAAKSSRPTLPPDQPPAPAKRAIERPPAGPSEADSPPSKAATIERESAS